MNIHLSAYQHQLLQEEVIVHSGTTPPTQSHYFTPEANAQTSTPFSNAEIDICNQRGLKSGEELPDQQFSCAQVLQTYNNDYTRDVEGMTNVHDEMQMEAFRVR